MLDHRSGMHEVFRPSRETSRWDKYDASFDKSVAAYLNSIRRASPRQCLASPAFSSSSSKQAFDSRSPMVPRCWQTRCSPSSRSLRSTLMRHIQVSGVDQPMSAIGLGAGTVAFTPERYDDAADLLDAFLAAGGNCVDTAHIYGFGKSEMTLGRWFEDTGRRDEVFLVTKGCHPVVDPDDMFARPWLPRVTPQAIRADLEESLRRLRTERVDLYLLHRDEESVEPGPLLEALNQEQERGRILAFGASNWSVGRIEQANRYATKNSLNGFSISSPSLSLARPTRMFFPGTLYADDSIRAWHRAQHSRCWRGPPWPWASPAAGSARRTRPSTTWPGSTSRTTTGSACDGRRSSARRREPRC